MRTALTIPVLAGMIFTAGGCGGGDAPRTDFPQQSPEGEYADSVRQMTDDLQMALQNEGLDGVESQIVGVVEGLAVYEDEPVGEHEETYRQIYEGAQELQAMFEQGSASEEQVRSKIEELQTLANELPKGDDSGGDEG